ncbi:MAG: hypothetical protein ACP5EP_11490 [Acidobacteriaceae bacterium]
MDKETFVYVDLDGVPHLMGRLWARVGMALHDARLHHKVKAGGLVVLVGPGGRVRPDSGGISFGNLIGPLPLGLGPSPLDTLEWPEQPAVSSEPLRGQHCV